MRQVNSEEEAEFRLIKKKVDVVYGIDGGGHPLIHSQKSYQVEEKDTEQNRWLVVWRFSNYNNAIKKIEEMIEEGSTVEYYASYST